MDTSKNFQGLASEGLIVSKTHRSIEEYMQDRVQYKIRIYFSKARRYKIYHLTTAVTMAISAALVPVLVNLDLGLPGFSSKILATFLSLLVTIGVALQEIFRFREHWRNYNLIDSNLRGEEMLFSTSASVYATKSQEEKNRLLVQRVEELIKDERWETIQMRTSTNRLTDDARLVEQIVNEYLDKKKITENTQGENH